ncbi:MAG: histidine phosphatase family protein, partial [Pseudomonadales bacterium]|nr:histidine phosphatase family protein [Pseudomonadales bacterium]
MNVIVIRHGQAQAQSTSDANRTLTAVGEQQAQKTAAWLANQGYQVDALFVSP